MFVSKRKIRKRIAELETKVRENDKKIETIKKTGYKRGDGASFSNYNSNILYYRRIVICLERTIGELKDLL